MNRDAKFNAIIQALECARERPGMYLFSQEAVSAMTFLAGFNLACYLFMEINEDSDTYRQVAVERGWNYPETFIVPAMRAQGFDEHAMIEELFTIMIHVWKQWQAMASSPPDPEHPTSSE